MTNYPHIDRLLGLHERLNVFYSVDGYNADFCTDEGDTVVETAWGETIEDALMYLDRRLENTTNAHIERRRQVQ